MDDFLHSAENIQEAESLKQNLKSLLQKGGFKLSRWQSKMKELCEKDSNVESVTALGLEWNLSSDDLNLCRGFAGKEHTIITHRVVLSVSSSIFDPLGLASPFKIRIRLILRLIWQKALKSWDEEIPQDVAKQYLDWLQEIPALKELSIDRHYGWQPGTNVQLHVFADASEMGLCVVAYLRFEKDYKVRVSFVMGKTRVALIKTTTIPKLALQAAPHASRVKASIIEEHDFTIYEVFMWSDSSTVIQWLNSFEKKQQIFVANRIGKILENTKLGEWNHIPGAQNPADLGTRGMRANEIASSVWLNGPAWLSENEAHWPKAIAACIKVEDSSETSQVVSLLPNKPLEIQWERFGSWKKLIHTICYVLRWRRFNQNRGVTSLDEYHHAERIIFKLVQKEVFMTEYDALFNGKESSSKSNIAQLCPFIVNQGIMRARGRLSKADFQFDTKHPILLPSKQPAIRLMMLKCHLDKYHQGVESMRHELQQKFWILGIRNALRNIKSRCISCRKYSAVGQAPIMTDLPKERVEKVEFPFTYVGVDYFGPIEVKYMRKTLKRWVCVFTCLSTKAIHLEMLELVYSLDTDSCLSAISRLIARQGHPSSIWSHNGTNFVGASNELKQFASMWQNSDFQEKLQQKKIVWKFQPGCSATFRKFLGANGEDMQSSHLPRSEWSEAY